MQSDDLGEMRLGTFKLVMGSTPFTCHRLTSKKKKKRETGARIELLLWVLLVSDVPLAPKHYRLSPTLLVTLKNFMD